MTDNDPISRRRRLMLAGMGSLAGLTATGVGTVSGEGTAKLFPETYGTTTEPGSSLTEPAYVRHPTDIPGVTERLQQYEQTGDPDLLMSPALKTHLTETDPETVDLLVSTAGEKHTISTNRLEREVNGWRPRAEVVNALEDYGEVRGVTKIGGSVLAVRGVNVTDLEIIIDEPPVYDLDLDFELPDFTPVGDGDGTFTAEEVRMDGVQLRLAEDDGAYGYISRRFRIGHINCGYNASLTDWATPWAEDQGIDTSLAKDFTFSGTWEANTRARGTNTMDTTAYMLKDRIENDATPHVPLRVQDGSGQNVYTIIGAIDYAIRNDIPVLITPIAVNGPYSECPATLCRLLDAYTDQGYGIIAPVGDRGATGAVGHPATSYHTVSVGGYDDQGQCTDGIIGTGLFRAPYSNTGPVHYEDSTTGQVTCDWCHDPTYTSGTVDKKVQPDVYACSDFTTDAGEVLTGTAYAAATIGAGEALKGNRWTYVRTQDSRLSDYHEMADDGAEMCNTDIGTFHGPTYLPWPKHPINPIEWP